MQPIRPAALRDKKHWIEMRSQLWPDSASEHPQQIQNFFDHCSNDIVETLLIFSPQNEVAGFIELNLRNFAEGSTAFKVPYIEGWFIKKPFRGCGYGKQLIQAAEQWAKQQGYRELASDTEIDNHQSIAIHKHLGYKEVERVVCFLKALD